MSELTKVESVTKVMKHAPATSWTGDADASSDPMMMGSSDIGVELFGA